MDIRCIVMAAGAASRFGTNKLLQTFRGTALYLRALRAIPKDIFSRVVVVTGSEDISRTAQAMGFSVVWNDRPAEGISHTVRMGLSEAGDCDGALFMTADQPLLSENTLRCLAAAFAETPDRIISAACGEKRGNPCVFPRSLFPALQSLQGDIGGSAVIRQNHHLLRLVQVPAADLVDCDTPEALLALEMHDFCEKTEEKPQKRFDKQYMDCYNRKAALKR